AEGVNEFTRKGSIARSSDRARIETCRVHPPSGAGVLSLDLRIERGLKHIAGEGVEVVWPIARSSDRARIETSTSISEGRKATLSLDLRIERGLKHTLRCGVCGWWSIARSSDRARIETLPANGSPHN